MSFPSKISFGQCCIQKWHLKPQTPKLESTLFPSLISFWIFFPSLTLCSVDFCLFYKYYVSFLYILFAQKFPQFEVPFAIHPSIHPSSMVTFARMGPRIGSRMLSKINTGLISSNYLSFPTWHIPVHPFRLMSHVLSTLSSFQYTQADVFTLVALYFITALILLIYRDRYCLLCAKSVLKAGDTVVNKTKINLSSHIML